MSEEIAKDFIENNMTEDLQVVIKKGTILYHGSLNEKLSGSLDGGVLFFGLEPSISFWYISELQQIKETQYDIEITHGYLYEFVVDTDIIVTYLPKIEEECTISNMLHLQEVFKGDPFRLSEHEVPSLSFELIFSVDKIGTEIKLLNRYIINIDYIRQEYNTKDVYEIYDWIRALNTHMKEVYEDQSEEETDLLQYQFQAKMISLETDKDYQQDETDDRDMEAIQQKMEKMVEEIEPFNKLMRDFVIKINTQKRKFRFKKNKYLNTKRKCDHFCKILIRSLNYYKNNNQMKEYKHLINEIYKRSSDRESFINYVTEILLEDDKYKKNKNKNK
jgi:hypothetical protein